VTARERAVSVVAASAACLQLQQDECPTEDLDSLARTIVDTAYGEGIDYTVTVMEPARACDATRRVWRECARALGQQLPSERRICATLAATKRIGALTFELAAAARLLDQLCQAAQQDPCLLGEARCRYDGLVAAIAQLAAEAPALARAIQAGLELRPEPESDTEPTPYRAHEVS
jgi:hypothetical protein